MSHHDPVGVVAGEPVVKPELPQRVPGSTLPTAEDIAEAYRTRGERHIEMDGGDR